MATFILFVAFILIVAGGITTLGWFTLRDRRLRASSRRRDHDHLPAPR